MTSMRKQRLLTNRSSQPKESGHIVQDNLNRKSRLIQKYQTDIQGLIEKIDNKTVNTPRGSRQTYANNERRTNQRDQREQREPVARDPTVRARSMTRNQTIPYDGSSSLAGNINDYSKLILGLEYALQNERKDRQLLQNKNISLETQISNLRNILVGPNEQKHYEKTVFKQYQDKITLLQTKIIDQKHNYEFIIDSKNQALASLQFQLRALQKNLKQDQKDKAMGRKMLQLMGQIEQLRVSVIKKNITIQRLKYMKMHDNDDDDEGSDDEAFKKKNLKEKLVFYIEQLEISNKLLLRKNIQILNLNKKTLKYEQILDVIEQYLDKKQVKNIDLNVLEHACINKLRLLLRQKVVFERQLLGQLNEHNKKISTFQTQILQRDNVNGNKIVEVINDNKRLSALVITLQNNIKNLQRNLQDEHRQEDILENQIVINRTQFVEEIKRLKEELNAISSVTKSQFDRMKLENLKLSQQNRSLLFLVGEKEKEISKKGDAIKTFVEYKDKINNLNISEPDRRRIQNTGEDNPQVGSKLILINTFSQWLMQWNKVKNWNNKKVLLNVILDKQQIREDALKSFTYLINIIHECMLNSKNIEVQEKTIILISHFVKHGILKNINLFVDKLSPIILRGFRQIIEGEDSQKHRVLNQASLKLVNGMQKNDMKWNHDMTNEMLSVNGLKYLFNLITTSQVDELVESAYNCLIMISKQNEMISFMNSYNVTTVLLGNLTNNYTFLIHVLYLLKNLLQSRDYIKSQKTLLEFRKIFNLIKDDEDEQAINLIFDCALLLMDNSLFTKSINKIQAISTLNQALRFLQEYHILKKIGDIYKLLLSELQEQNITKMMRQSDKLIEIINTKRFNENRFNRSIRILLQIVTSIADNTELDEKIIGKLIFLYEFYEEIDNKTRIRMNAIVNTVFQRNKDAINRVTNEEWLTGLIQSYKKTTVNEELIFLLKIMMFQHEQKRTTEILRSGRESLIGKLIGDSLVADYNVAYSALRNLLSISKEKYSEKFVNKGLFTKFLTKVLISRNEEDFIGTVISILYFFCKNEETSVICIELGLVQKILKVISQRHDKENIVYKCLTLLELCHTTNYKRKILNYFLSSDSNLQNLKIINHCLRKAKNKQQMGTRAVFLYDFLNGKTCYESLALLIQQNIWMVQDLVELRNEYVQKLDPLVYKIQLLLHNMSTSSAKVRKAYEKFKIAGGYNSQDDN